jgi:hypothetical protein
VSAQGRSAQPQTRADVATVGAMMTALDTKLARDEAALQNKETQLEVVRPCRSARAHMRAFLLIRLPRSVRTRLVPRG